ncbi:MAG: hypothetical protein JXA21_24815 [Anaerolineae bacterium]|nr:hypothetical protein [Anaerolineae bacterium]
MNKTNRVMLAIAVMVVLASGASWAQARWGSVATLASPGSGFTYQGQLNDANGAPVNDTCAFRFSLWGSESGDDQIGGDAPVSDIAVDNGAFTALVNAGGEFGAAAFNGHARWLGIAVRCSGAADYTPLSPRQALSPAPYAHYAEKAGSAPQRNIAAPAPNNISVLDSAGNVGAHPSVAIGVDGLPIIVYADDTNKSVKTAHCDDPQCLTATIHTLDSQITALQTSIKIGADGFPLIAYFSPSTEFGQLKVAHCTDVACSNATIRLFENEYVGDLTLLIGQDGLGLIVFHKTGHMLDHLRVAHCNDTACSNADFYTIDTNLFGGKSISASILGNGLPMIAYFDGAGSNLELHVIQCNDPACASRNTPFIEAITGSYATTGMATGKDGLGMVAYYDQEDQSIKARVCYTPSGQEATLCEAPYHVQNVDLQYPKIEVTIGADGLPLLVYTDLGIPGFNILHCSDSECRRATNNAFHFEPTLDTPYPNVATGADGLPLIVYQDAANDDLKVMHCSNAFCAPYYRQP